MKETAPTKEWTSNPQKDSKGKENYYHTLSTHQQNSELKDWNLDPDYGLKVQCVYNTTLSNGPSLISFPLLKQ